MPGAFLNIFDFLDYTFFLIKNNLNFSRLLVSFASLAELHTSPAHCTFFNDA